MGEQGCNAITTQGMLCDDLLEVLGCAGVRQFPGLSGARVQARGICRSSIVESGVRLARKTGCRLRLRGIIHRAESFHLERGLPRVVALDQCSATGRAYSLPGQCGDVAVAKGGG